MEFIRFMGFTPTSPLREVMEYIGGRGEFNYKILALVLWGCHTVDYIRRQGNRMQVKTRPIRQRFGLKSGRQVINAFRTLESLGYIYNVRIEVGRVTFNLNIPRWLQPTEESSKLERNVSGGTYFEQL